MSVMKTDDTESSIAISWVELPAYGAHLIGAGITRLKQPVAVIAIRPQIPIKGMEDILGQKICWIDRSNVNSWQELGLPVPDMFFQAGWYIPSFINLGKEVRDNGGKVVALADNCWKNNIRQWMGAIKFRLLYRKWFSAVWVPGKSGARLLRFFGVSSSQIYQGLYGADHNCFTPGPHLSKRPKQFIFVGGLTRLKGIPTLVKAFKVFHREFSDWKLVTYGIGESQILLENCAGIECRPFGPPAIIAEALAQSRYFVLPTLTDHWPLVVAEAAVAGCGLILSNRVGNRLEFLNEKNGFEFPAHSVSELTKRLREAASLGDCRLNEVYNESVRLGSFYGSDQWAEKFHQIIVEVGER